MPLSGEILSYNSELDNSPEKVNDDPYGEGWMIRIKLTDHTEIDSLLDCQQYEELIK